MFTTALTRSPGQTSGTHRGRWPLKDWSSVERLVRPAFERIDTAVRKHAPNIAGGIYRTTPGPRRQFEIQAGYMWDSQREFEDLLITMEYVVIDDRMRRDPGSAPTFLAMHTDG
jgi:hypothetical protein